MRYYILFISSALDPEDTWMEAAHAWLFVVKLVGLRGCSFSFKNLSLIVLPDDTLKAYHASIRVVPAPDGILVSLFTC